MEKYARINNNYFHAIFNVFTITSILNFVACLLLYLVQVNIPRHRTLYGSLYTC